MGALPVVENNAPEGLIVSERQLKQMLLTQVREEVLGWKLLKGEAVLRLDVPVKAFNLLFAQNGLDGLSLRDLLTMMQRAGLNMHVKIGRVPEEQADEQE